MSTSSHPILLAALDLDGTLAPNAEGRLFVLGTVGGWPSALVDARADSADGVADLVRRSVADGSVRAPSGATA